MVEILGLLVNVVLFAVFALLVLLVEGCAWMYRKLNQLLAAQ